MGSLVIIPHTPTAVILTLKLSLSLNPVTVWIFVFFETVELFISPLLRLVNVTIQLWTGSVIVQLTVKDVSLNVFTVVTGGLDGNPGYNIYIYIYA